MHLDLYQLKTFWTFAKVRNVTQTAELTFVTQSAVSHALKKLENSVKVRLYARRGGVYELTEAGEELFRTCDRVFSEIDRCESILDGEGGDLRQKMIMGAPVEFGTTLLLRELARFIPAHPDIRLHCTFSHNLHLPLLRDELDLIVDCKTFHHKEIDRIFLFREQYVVVASPAVARKHRLREPKDLARVTALSLDEKGEWWDNFIMALPKEHPSVLSQIMQINHVRGLINGALAEIGVAFVPRYTVEGELRDGRLLDLFPGRSCMDDQFCIYVKREHRNLPQIKNMIAFLLDAFTDFKTRRNQRIPAGINAVTAAGRRRRRR